MWSNGKCPEWSQKNAEIMSVKLLAAISSSRETAGIRSSSSSSSSSSSIYDNHSGGSQNGGGVTVSAANALHTGRVVGGGAGDGMDARGSDAGRQDGSGGGYSRQSNAAFDDDDGGGGGCDGAESSSGGGALGVANAAETSGITGSQPPTAAASNPFALAFASMPPFWREET